MEGRVTKAKAPGSGKIGKERETREQKARRGRDKRGGWGDGRRSEEEEEVVKGRSSKIDQRPVYDETRKRVNR